MAPSQDSNRLTSIQKLEAGLQNLTVDKPKPEFLSLSGELRNKIYSFLTNERIIQNLFSDARYTPSSQTGSYLDKSAHQIVLCHENEDDMTFEPREWSTMQRYDLGLAQTCRQIRREYEASYWRNHEMCISLDALVSSIAELKNNQPPVLPSGNVRITIRESSWSTPNIDILPLLKVYKRFPSFTLQFHLPEHARAAFRDVFSVRDNAGWWDGVAKHVTSIHVFPEVDGERAKVGITIRKEFKMGRRRGRSGMNKDKVVAEWLREMGVDALSRWAGLRVYVV